MIPDTEWQPTQSDVAWQRGLVAAFKNHATWAVPGTMSVFEINKLNNTFKLKIGSPEEETNRRIAKVFKILGFVETENFDKPGGESGIDFSNN